MKSTPPLLIGSNWTKLWDPDYRGGRHKRILHGSSANLLKLMKFAADFNWRGLEEISIIALI